MSVHTALAASAVPTERTGFGFDRAILLAFSLALLALSVLHRYLAMQRPELAAAPVAEVNSGEFLALAAIVKLLVVDRDAPVRLGFADLGVLALASLVWLVPHANIPFVAFTAGGVWLWWRHRGDPVLVPLAQIWLALSGYEFWGKLIFKLASSFVIEAETGVLASVGRLVYPTLAHDGIRLMTSPDWFVYMLEGCSSFHNISLAVLVWVCTVRLMDGWFDRRLGGALVLGVLGVFVINVVRVLLMVPSEARYLFWHEGPGATIVAAATLAAVAIPTILALRRQEAAQ